jgi:hypothetical protein
MSRSTPSQRYVPRCGNPLTRGGLVPQKGTLLINDAQAVALAEGIIRKIKREKIKTKDDLGTILGSAIIVMRKGYGAVLTIPFFPGSA